MEEIAGNGDRWLWFSPPLRLATGAVAIAAVLVLTFIFIPRGNVGLGPSQSPGERTPSAVTSPTGTQAPTVSPPAPGALTYDTHVPFAAIVLVNDLRVRETPATGAVLGKVNAGDTVMIRDEQTIDGMTWYEVAADGDLTGWVAAGPGDVPWLDLKYRVAQRFPPGVEGIVGGAGFVAWGRGERIGSDDGGRWVAASEDGREWQLGTVPAEAQHATTVLVAHGPAGWLMVSSLLTWDEHNVLTTSVGAWSSTDGLTWEKVNLPADFASNSTLDAAGLTGSPSGYILSGYSCYVGENCGPIFASRDLATWTRLDAPSTSSEVMTVGDGFLIRYSGPDMTTTRYTDLVHSVDVAEGGHAGAWTLGPWSARAGNRLVTIALVGDAPSRELLTARIPDWNAPAPALSWASWPAAAATFDGSTVAEMLTVGDEAVVLGSSYATGALKAWRTADGITWHAIDTAALGDYAVGPVASAGGVLVAVASEATAPGRSPRFARWTATDGWSVEQRPVLGTTEHAVVGACPELPDTALEWGAIPGAVGAECFGDEPISFVAWQPRESQSGNVGSTWITEPGWLLDTFDISIVEANWTVGIAVRSPHATGDVAPGTWVRLTGHWADAEASACRYRPDPTFPIHGLGAPAGNCSGTFVLTGIAPAP
jgi:hypothetical protein